MSVLEHSTVHQFICIQKVFLLLQPKLIVLFSISQTALCMPLHQSTGLNNSDEGRLLKKTDFESM